MVSKSFQTRLQLMKLRTVKWFDLDAFQRWIAVDAEIFSTINFSSLNFSSLKVFDDDFSNVEYFSRQQNIFRAPKNREASISLYRCRVNAKDMLLAKKKKQRDRSRHRRNVRFLEENIGRASKKLFGPRKARCVDFIKQTYSKRYDFSTVFDRGEG